MDDAPLRPMREATPAACAEVRRALEVGIREFRRWGIEPPPGSWIQRAADRLNAVVARDSLGDNDDELRQTSAAMALAVDFYHIGISLGSESNRQIAAELSAVARGRLLGRGAAAAGSDFLTQFWVGTLLAQSKLQPRIIAGDRPGISKPDFIITKGKIDFVVEVKRPRTAGSAERAVKTAAKQLRDHNNPGIIIVDAADCISADPWGITGKNQTTRDQIRVELDALHTHLGGMVDSRKRSPQFVQVAMLLTFARFWSWTRGESAEPTRDAGLHFHARSFSYKWSMQVTRVTEDVQQALLIGVEQLTGNSPVYQFF